MRGLEHANTVAGDAIAIERYGLPKDYYKNTSKRLDASTAEDVQAAAQKYLASRMMLIAVVGSEKDVKEKLAKFGPTGHVC